MDNNGRNDPSAFDPAAAEYDDSFTNTRLGRMLRDRVWRHLGECFTAGQFLLDLACGTGEDALWLAKQGIHVLALDGSAEMVRLAIEKANAISHTGEITIIQATLQQVIEQPLPDLVAEESHLIPPSPAVKSLLDSPPSEQFDGLVSNFGGLNVIDRWHELARTMAGSIRSGGILLLVPMGPVCPWEVGWYLFHGSVRTAFRRLRQPSLAKVGDSSISIWYPSPRRLIDEFSPWFTPRYLESLGLFLPPSYLAHLVERWPRLSNLLNNLERRIGRFAFGWGDHYILILERNGPVLES